MTAAQHLKTGLLVVLGLFLAFVCLEGLLLFHHAIDHAPVNNDAGYYLSSVERYADGWVPYHDLRAGYTPLGFHILLGARLVVGESMTFGGYATVVFLFLVLGAALTWRLARRLGAGRFESAGGAALMLLLAYASEGTQIALEPFVAVFVLLALHACLSALDRPLFLLLAGICVSLAFLSKQYGVAALAPVGLFALATGRGFLDRVRRGALVAVGFLVPIVVLLLAYRVLFGVAPADLLRGWSGRGYAWWGPGPAVEVVGRLAWPGLLILVWLPFVAFGEANRRNPGFWLVVLTALVMLTPLMVRSYEHYLLLSIPFFAVLGALVVTWGLEKRWRGVAVALTALLTLGLTARSAYRDFRRHRDTWDRPAQVRAAEAVGEHTTVGRVGQVFGEADQWLNYLVDLRPPLPARVGYSFPGNFTAETTAAVLERTPLVIGRTTALDDKGRLRALLAEHGFVRVDVIGEDLEVHRRTR